jgi:tRNA pseudouridine32 synthase / 23S rRNA pseudouridine746 synthase
VISYPGQFNSYTCFTRFKSDVSNIPLPSQFTYPFNYDPHQLCIIASEELKQKIQSLPHVFDSVDGETESLGKMFGVLIVKNQVNDLGYLAAFSGKLFGGNLFEGFVPPVFDTLDPDGFYKKGEEEINEINKKIQELEEGDELCSLFSEMDSLKKEYIISLENLNTNLKQQKINRNERRNSIGSLPENERAEIENMLNNESARDHYLLKDFKRNWKEKLLGFESRLAEKTQIIQELKNERKLMSAALQKKLFDAYHFLNGNGELKNLRQIFNINEENIPPSGAGECAAPKLIHFAYVNGYKPVAMAEFWWGASPQSEIRKHGHFYPACKSKCLPILTHMLEGLDVEPNPMDHTIAKPKHLDIIYEDAFIIVVNKPEGLLSVPGKEVKDSVQQRIADLFPDIVSPMIVHRLDMSTSGIMILAKSLEVYHNLQAQFTNRKIVKRYDAILDGVLHSDEGIIELPLRVDLDNRPRQMVCYTYGKPAKTKYKVINKDENTTLIHFWPITGRTHQLRVHSAHSSGLNLPILGDDLYGRRSDRLYLHAAYIQFWHPGLQREMTLEVPSGF